MVLLLNISSLLVVLIFSIFSFESIKLNAVQTKNHCRYGLYSIQSETANKTNKLLKLNPAAKKLRVQIKSTKIALAAALAALSPQVVAILKVRLKYLKIKKFALIARQKFLLSQIYLYKTSALILLKNKLLGDFGFSKNANSLSSTLRFKKSPTTSKIPNYNLIPSSKNRANKINLSWRITSKYLKSNWLSFLHIKKDFQQSCSAEIIKKGNLWHPRLIIKG